MTILDLAQRYLSIGELPGGEQHPLIQWWLSLCHLGLHQPDETPWCSAFVNGIAWEFNLPRSASAAARSWLKVGIPVPVDAAKPGDVVILSRGHGAQPGPETIDAPGHVGFFVSTGPIGSINLLAGNQGNKVSVAPEPKARILGVRRLQA